MLWNSANLPIRRLTWRMALVMMSVGALLIGITFYSGRAMDNASLTNERALIDNALSSRLVRAISEARSVAWWDEAVVKSGPQEFDRDWLDLEVGAFMTDSYKHDQIAIIDDTNQPVYNYSPHRTLDQARLMAELSQVSALFSQVRGGKNVSPRIPKLRTSSIAKSNAAVQSRKYGMSAAAIRVVSGQPMLVTVMAITPSVDYALLPKSPRLLVSFIQINKALLSDIGSNTLLPDIAFSRGVKMKTGSFLLSDDEGKPITTIVWTSKRPGTAMVGRVLPWIIGALIIASGLMIILMIKLSRSTHQLAEREIEAQHLANHDALTGLPNRRMLKSQFAKLGKGFAPDARAVSVACIDLDRFKDINDTLGHQAGDELIKAVSARIADILRPADVLARLGGDELAVLRHYRSANDGDALSETLTACFGRPFSVLGHEIEAHASIGVANGSIGSNFDDLMRQADIALYEAKAQGRARAVRFVAPMAEKLQKRHSIETDLRRALTDREMILHYQPIVEAASGAMTSVEALMRWTSPIHGSVSPDVFIGIAEESGMMAELGRFVIERAIEDSQKWPQLSTAINISPAQLRSATIVQDLVSATTCFRVSPDQITLEITESVLMSSDERTLRVLNQLKSKGFGLALDDFGTGYSSLSYLRDFPFDKLKIDRSFVKGLSINDRALAIVEGVVNFGRILGREIVAEGIETEQEMQAMQQAGCTHLQGFLFSRALPAEHIEALAATFGRLSAQRLPVLKSAIDQPKAAPVAVNIRQFKA